MPESYRAAYEANPYANQKADGGFLGIGRRKAQQEMNLRAREYDANLIAAARQEQYNSASEQADRLREAGINPALDGSLSAGEASAADVPIGDVNFPDGGQQMAAFTDTLLNIASLVMSVPAGLSSLAGERLSQGLQIASAGSDIAKAFPSQMTNIAPAPLAPVMRDTSIPADKLAALVPGLSGRQQKSLAKSIGLNRDSLRSSLSSARDRKELFDLLNSPALSAPDDARQILSLAFKLQLNDLKYRERLSAELAENRDKIAKQTAENKIMEGDADAAQSGAQIAEAGARSAEAGLRSEIARSTDGKAIGEAKTEEAIRSKVESEKAEEALNIIDEAEEEGLFGHTLFRDILNARVTLNPKKDASTWNKIMEDWDKRKKAKRYEKRKYGRNSSSGSVSISPKGVSYSE